MNTPGIDAPSAPITNRIILTAESNRKTRSRRNSRSAEEAPPRRKNCGNDHDEIEYVPPVAEEPESVNVDAQGKFNDEDHYDDGVDQLEVQSGGFHGVTIGLKPQDRRVDRDEGNHSILEPFGVDDPSDLLPFHRPAHWRLLPYRGNCWWKGERCPIAPAQSSG